jgi:hypothetical protein
MPPALSSTKEKSMRRLAIASALALTSLGVLAVPASADPAATFCGSIDVTVNGQALIDQDSCQVLPPEA